MRNLFIPFIFAILCCVGCSSDKKKNNIKKEINQLKFADTSVFQFIDFNKEDIDFENLNDSVFENHLKNFSIDTVNGIPYYIIEGDLLMTKMEYYQYKNQRDFLPVSLNAPKLLGYKIGNKIIKQPEHLNMKYAIVKSSFNNIAQYDSVKNNMIKATKDWMGLCNVKFNYIAELDDLIDTNDNPDSLTFVVRKAKGTYNARAFFPDQAKELRKIKITPVHFNSDYDKTGILRHELGHVLGFLHEHILLDEDFCREASSYQTNSVTDYDPKSVMHYYCEGIGTHKLKFTQKDSLGAIAYYPFK